MSDRPRKFWYLGGSLLVVLAGAWSLTGGVYAPARKSAYLQSQEKCLRRLYEEMCRDIDVRNQGFPKKEELTNYFEGGVSQFGDVYLAKLQNGEIVICNILHATRYGDLVSVLRSDGSTIEGVAVVELELIVPRRQRP